MLLDNFYFSVRLFLKYSSIEGVDDLEILIETMHSFEVMDGIVNIVVGAGEHN